MIPQHLHKPLGLLGSGFILAVGEWVGSSKEILGLAGIFFGCVGAVAYAVSLTFDCLHKFRIERKEAAQELKETQDEVCRLRRLTGVCPLSTFKLPPDDAHT